MYRSFSVYLCGAAEALRCARGSLESCDSVVRLVPKDSAGHLLALTATDEIDEMALVALLAHSGIDGFRIIP